MRIQRLRIGLEVGNKLNGKFYKVVSIQDSVGTAKEMIIDKGNSWSGKFGEEEITIDEGNALAFRIVNDPEPYPIPAGYSVIGGKLLKDDVPACETGNLTFTKLLAVQRDFVILAAKREDTKERMAELMSYRVSRDRFTRLISIPEDTILVGYVGENNLKAILAYSNVAEAEKNDEKDGITKKIRSFDKAEMIALTNGVFLDRYTMDAPITLNDIIIKEIPSCNGQYVAFLPSDEDDDGNGYLIPSAKRRWFRVNGSNPSFVFMADGKIQADWSYAYKEFVIKTQDMVIMPSQKIEIKAGSQNITKLEGYDTLIDITKEDCTYKLTFSNEDYEFKTLVSRTTRDRGYVVTVE